MNTAPRRHEHLWLSDGNVVLATESLLFRVHKSVLSLHSSVFKDMFDIPLTGDVPRADATDVHSHDGKISADLYEGLPLVALSGDRGEDVAYLLRAIYERGTDRYYDYEDDTTPLEMVVALLSLSSKYDVPSVRKDVVKQLSRNYPTELAQYESLTNMEGLQLFGSPRHECHFPLLKACIITHTDLQRILPVLFYSCCSLGYEKIIVHEASSLAFPTLQRLLLGERRLSDIIRRTLANALRSLSPPEGCPSGCGHCNTAQRSPWTSEMANLFSTSQLSDLSVRHVSYAFFERRCDRCIAQLGEALKQIKEIVWVKMPELFGFQSWDSVKGA